MDINKDFKSACRVLFGGELGDLEDFSAFLTRYVEPLKSAKSILSKKDVYFFEPYCKGAKLISLEEAGKIKSPALNINDIKDIDSLLAAAQESFAFSGNKVLGTSHDVEEVENCINSSFIYRSHEIFDSEHAAYCQVSMSNKYVFGCSYGADSSFCMNCTEYTKAVRCFECACNLFCSDQYFCYNCKQCIDTMFSFNQYSKRQCIGNNVLEKSKYSSLKQKLVAEIAQELKEKKTFPSLVEISSGAYS
ncbi:Uncharacterised protein [Candidatus Anstonella stagnisolia]|nr:Uncharacterised protein [Candidatus Anstonella stagnisolia]